MRNFILLNLCFLICYCNSLKKESLVTKLPDKINVRYGLDLIDNEEIALNYSKIVLKNKYKNINFDLCVYNIKLVGNNKVWEIEVIVNRTGYTGFDKTIYIRINKNTGEILNLWDVK